MEPLLIKNVITINANASKVWDALVNPEQTKKYMFGCETISDWKQGSTLLWQGEWEGKKMIFVKGNIVTIRPGNFLSYTVIDPNNSAIPDLPENYLTVTYDLKAEKGQTILTVTQGDYNTVADGEKRYLEAYNNGEGWNPILVQIKKLGGNAKLIFQGSHPLLEIEERNDLCHFERTKWREKSQRESIIMRFLPLVEMTETNDLCLF